MGKAKKIVDNSPKGGGKGDGKTQNGEIPNNKSGSQNTKKEKPSSLQSSTSDTKGKNTLLTPPVNTLAAPPKTPSRVVPNKGKK